MRFPGFTGEVVLSRPSGRYGTPRRARKLLKSGSLYLAIAWQSGETIAVCPPGKIRVGEGEDAFCIKDPTMSWEMAPLPPATPAPTPPGGGGGGGGGGASGDGGTFRMDTKCARAGQRCLIDTATQKCAIWRCQIDYCEKNECTEAEQEKARDAQGSYDAADCELFPCRNIKRNPDISRPSRVRRVRG
jgi:hypothetical protein